MAIKKYGRFFLSIAIFYPLLPQHDWMYTTPTKDTKVALLLNIPFFLSLFNMFTFSMSNIPHTVAVESVLT